jgi:hypothetical protein
MPKVERQRPNFSHWTVMEIYPSGASCVKLQKGLTSQLKVASFTEQLATLFRGESRLTNLAGILESGPYSAISVRPAAHVCEQDTKKALRRR